MRCGVVYTGVEVVGSADPGRRWVGRIVWTRARPHRSGMGYLDRVLFVCRLLERVWLKTKTSAIVCTFRAR